MPLSRLLLLIVTLLNYGFLFPCLPALAEGEADPLWNRPSYEKKVIDIGQRLLATNGIEERIVFLTVHTDVRNASASRFGGPNTIVIYKDMLDVITSDDELAAILGHEIAHITKRHTGKVVPRQMVAKTALWTAYTAGGTLATLATGGLAAPVFILGAAGMKKMNRNGIAITDPISRPYEKEADLVGLDYLVKAGYNPLAMETIMAKGSGDAGPITAFFSSHPVGTERLTYIHEAIKAKYPQYLTPDMANNPLSGSLYQLAEPTAPIARDTAKPPEAQSKPTQTPETKTPEAQNSQKPETGLQTPPKKMSYQSPKPENTPATQSSVKPQGITKATLLKAAGQAEPSAQSVAEVLLTLNPDQLKILQLIRQKQFMTREDLESQLEYQEPNMLHAFLLELCNKRLIKILGASPEEVLVLTDWASEGFSK